MLEIDDYAFACDGLFLIPAEHLGPEGLDEAYRDALRDRTDLGDGWIALFEEAFRAYWRRTAELSKRTSMYWFPPRVLNVGIVTDAERVHPYSQPFHRSSWLLYASDFDPETSNVELGAFQLLQAERMGLLQQVAPVLAGNLSYWLTRSEEEAELFRAACAASTRPDAKALRALADALPWIRELHHEVLRPPPGVATADPPVPLPRTGLLVPRSRTADVDRLLGTWTRVAQQAVERHAGAHAARHRNHAEDVCAWLREERPRALVTGRQGRILWDPDRPSELAAVRTELKGITASGAERVRDDLALVDRHCRAFLDSVLRPEDLPAPDPRAADQNGLSYMHVERREVAYNVCEAGMQRLREPAPPYERFMLGARTVHEWGHLATTAGWVPVPEERRAEHDEALRDAGALFDEMVAEAPDAVRRVSAAPLAELAGGEATAGPALVRFALSRVEDFQANLLSQRYLDPEERETYVRNNIRSLVHDYTREGFFQRLARYAYEYQYLRFGAVEDPRAYFRKVTWIGEQYLDPGIVSEERFGRLLQAMGRICDTYAVDEGAFRRGPREHRLSSGLEG